MIPEEISSLSILISCVFTVAVDVQASEVSGQTWAPAHARTHASGRLGLVETISRPHIDAKAAGLGLLFVSLECFSS